MYIAFLKSRNASCIGRLIDWLCGGWGYCHVALIFTDGKVFSTDPETGPSGFSGAQFWDSMEDYFAGLGNWATVYKSVPPEHEKIMRAAAEQIVGTPYGMQDLFHQLLTILPAGKTPVCSQLCMMIMQMPKGVDGKPIYYPNFSAAETNPDEWAKYEGLPRA